MNFHHHMQGLYQAAGYTYSQIADRSGVPRSTAWAIINGPLMGTWPQALAVIHALDGEPHQVAQLRAAWNALQRGVATIGRAGAGAQYRDLRITLDEVHRATDRILAELRVLNAEFAAFQRTLKRHSDQEGNVLTEQSSTG